MDIYDKIKTIFKSSKEQFRPSKGVLLYSSAGLFLFLILAAATAYFILPLEARGGADFNLRSIYPLTSYVQKGEIVPLRFNVFTSSSGLYELKIYSPGGDLVFRSLKPVKKSGPGVWTVTSRVEAKEFGQYDVELLRLFNKNENQSYKTSFWIGDFNERQKRLSESSFSEDKLSFNAVDNFSDSNNLTEELEPASSEFSGNNSSLSLENESASPTNNSSMPVKEVGSLYINSIPIESTIYLNGHDMGRTPLNIDNLPVGNYSLVLALEGYETFETKVDILAGKTTTVYQPLAKIQPSDDEKKPFITALHIKAFIIFLIAGFLVYAMIELLLKDGKSI